ncbi:MAG: substrate-binding domain-containing protein, partial [Proteobacteria bacterium]|nr:substrate-binding domain-containing protein [Pseudomonadota bacterium]
GIGFIFIKPTPPTINILAYSGSGMKLPMLEIKKIYEQQNPHIIIDYSFSGSRILERTIRTLSKGDIFMPGDKKYISSLNKDNLIIAKYPVALHIPTIIVHNGNNKINSWDDLAKKGIKLCIPNAKMASIGKVARVILNLSPLQSQIQANITLLATSTAESVKFLLEQKVDAVISWHSMVMIAPDKLRTIKIPENINKIKEIWISIPKFTTNQTEAQKFAQFVAGASGQKIFSEMGFKLVGN